VPVAAGYDPIQNRRLSPECWNGDTGHDKCTGWTAGAPKLKCECLCHQRVHHTRPKKADPGPTLMEKYGTIDVRNEDGQTKGKVSE